MEIRLRNIDPAIVAVIDEYAKENNESRNMYLNRLIQWDAKKKPDEKNKYRYERKNEATYFFYGNHD